MAAVSAELDAAIAAAERDDGASWWARTSDGEWYPARILGFNQQVADAARAAPQRPLPVDPVVHRRQLRAARSRRGRLGRGSAQEDRCRRGHVRRELAQGLLVGRTQPRTAAALTVGISVTGAGRENGELGVVAGSRRANVPRARRRRPRPAARAAPDAHRRRHRALLVHAAHEPASGLRRAPCRLHRLRPRAATGRPTRRARPGRDPPPARRARRQLGTPEGEPERPGGELRARLTRIIRSNRSEQSDRWGEQMERSRRTTVRKRVGRRSWVSCSRARSCYRAVVVSAGTATVQRPEGAGPPVAASGMGTQAALDNPRCRARRPDVRSLRSLRQHVGGGGPACVKAWKEGADNGGATCAGRHQGPGQGRVRAPQRGAVQERPGEAAQSGLEHHGYVPGRSQRLPHSRSFASTRRGAVTSRRTSTPRAAPTSRPSVRTSWRSRR